MIEANKRLGFKRLFYLYQKYHLIRKHFSTVSITGDIDEKTEVPTIYIANHSSWWDGLLIFQLTERFSKNDHYIMMNESGLNEYRFFQKLGAYSVNRDQPKDVVRSLLYTQDLIAQGKKIWLFPQGAIEHPQAPLQFQKGIGYLIQQFEKAAVKPVTFHYYHYEHPKTIGAIDVGAAKLINTTQSKLDIAKDCEALLQAQRDKQVKALIDKPDAPFDAPYMSLR
ncbi:1-acyl-sn-glycerol-3-phosphate acyltransferase [Alkalibacillus flavidus]|uniref:1-acyl-sn-glycerol-3-phosphate acyltransferase n=1 Tax=Alkalibacillus flavidus TaxID=546021 RepID=A0ABV2KT97_9BACI